MSASAVKAGEAYVEILLEGQEEMKDQLEAVQSKLDKLAGEGFGKMKSSVVALNQGLELAGKALGFVRDVTLAAWEAGQKFVDILEQQAEKIDDVAKTAIRMGTSVDFVSAMKYGAELAGSDLKQFETAIKAWQRNLQSFSIGVGEAKATLVGLKFKPEDFMDKTLEQQLFMLADKISGIENPTKRAGAAMRIFGESGTQILPMLLSGSDGLREMRREAEALGLVLEDSSGKAAQELQDNFLRIKSLFQGIRYTIFTEFAPAISNAIQYLIPLIQVLRDDLTNAVIASNESLHESLPILDDAITSFTLLGQTLVTLAAGFLYVSSSVLKFERSMITAHKMMSFIKGDMLMVNIAQSVEDALTIAADTVDAAADSLFEAGKTLPERFREAYEAWKAARTELSDFNMEAGGWVSDLQDAAQTLKEVFVGDAIRKNAAGMQRIQEMGLRTQEKILAELREFKPMWRQMRDDLHALGVL